MIKKHIRTFRLFQQGDRNRNGESDIPEWQKDIVLMRLEDFKNNPNSALGFDLAMDEIEKNL